MIGALGKYKPGIMTLYIRRAFYYYILCKLLLLCYDLTRGGEGSIFRLLSLASLTAEMCVYIVYRKKEF
jgi:hypothetical protein